MASVAKALRARHSPDQVYILVAKRNSGSFTYDGIERGGERVCLEIEEELDIIKSKGGSIKKLSIAGYSLGGLVARYAIGLLFARGVLDNVECMVRRTHILINKSPADLTAIELCRVCEPVPGSTDAAPGVGEPGMERPGRADAVHVRAPALRH
jgi:hypothetical protein